MATNLNVSKHIENFIRFHSEAIKQYTYCFEKVNECDKLTQDLLHKLEIDNVSTDEKNKIATQLKYCRRDRRYYKDRVEELEPFISLFINKDTPREKNNTVANPCLHNKETINRITNCLGTVRKMEEYHKCRTYKPRILKDTYMSGE